MKTILRNTLILLIFLPLISFASQANTYQISLIVFEHINITGISNEAWFPPQNITDPKKCSMTKFLPPKNSTLAVAAKKLKKSRYYRLLTHLTWQQEFNNTNFTPICITGGFKYNDLQELQGTIAINHNRYFNIRTNLVLNETADYLTRITRLASNFNSAMIGFKMQQQRRLQLNELNYIDTPAFGILIKITKAKSGPSWFV
jgi:hypothetical protein